MQITIFGAGYVGLVTGICLAGVGHSVVCVDVDVEKRASLVERLPVRRYARKPEPDVV